MYVTQVVATTVRPRISADIDSLTFELYLTCFQGCCSVELHHLLLESLAISLEYRVYIMALVSADIYCTAVELFPARRATLNHRKSKAAAYKLQQYSGLSWGTPEAITCMPSTAVTCMGGLVLFLFLQHLLCKWKKVKGAHPIASCYAAKGASVYHKFTGKAHKIWRRQKRRVVKKLILFCLMCVIVECLIGLKLTRAWRKCKKKLIQPLFDRCRSIYFKVAIFFYGNSCFPVLKVSAVVIFLKLFMSGNVELNPGPEGKFSIVNL